MALIAGADDCSWLPRQDQDRLRYVASEFQLGLIDSAACIINAMLFSFEGMDHLAAPSVELPDLEELEKAEAELGGSPGDPQKEEVARKALEEAERKQGEADKALEAHRRTLNSRYTQIAGADGAELIARYSLRFTATASMCLSGTYDRLGRVLYLAVEGKDGRKDDGRVYYDRAVEDIAKEFEDAPSILGNADWRSLRDSVDQYKTIKDVRNPIAHRVSAIHAANTLRPRNLQLREAGPLMRGSEEILEELTKEYQEALKAGFALARFLYFLKGVPWSITRIGET